MEIKKTIFLLLVILLLGGCSLGFDEQAAEQSPNEILLAQECGMDGLRCCADEPKCSFGQACCIDPNDQSQTRCSNECSCGGQDEFCCADNQCGDGLVCLEGSCTACGAENQPCCGDICQSVKGKNGGQLLCYQQQCLACGQLATPCCQEEPFCRLMDDLSLGFCQDGLCAACGGNEQAACLADQACLAGYLLSEGRCYQCGGLNQPCCVSQTCSNDSFVCLSGFCQPK